MIAATIDRFHDYATGRGIDPHDIINAIVCVAERAIGGESLDDTHVSNRVDREMRRVASIVVTLLAPAYNDQELVSNAMQCCITCVRRAIRVADWSLLANRTDEGAANTFLRFSPFSPAESEAIVGGLLLIGAHTPGMMSGLSDAAKDGMRRWMERGGVPVESANEAIRRATDDPSVANDKLVNATKFLTLAGPVGLVFFNDEKDSHIVGAEILVILLIILSVLVLYFRGFFRRIRGLDHSTDGVFRLIRADMDGRSPLICAMRKLVIRSVGAIGETNHPLLDSHCKRKATQVLFWTAFVAEIALAIWVFADPSMTVVVWSSIGWTLFQVFVIEWLMF